MSYRKINFNKFLGAALSLKSPFRDIEILCTHVPSHKLRVTLRKCNIYKYLAHLNALSATLK